MRRGGGDAVLSSRGRLEGVVGDAAGQHAFRARRVIEIFEPVGLRRHHQVVLAQAKLVERFGGRQQFRMHRARRRRWAEQFHGLRRLRARHHRHAADVGRLVAEGNPQPQRQKNGKDEDPEDDFRLAIHLLQPRQEQEFVAFPTAGDRRIGEIGDR